VLVHGHGEDGSKAHTLDRGRGYAERGWLALCWSVRGQGGSEGLSYHLGARELFDLQDVIAWVRRSLPVRSDKIAVCGSSQGGWHAWMAAAHADVATVVPENIFVDYPDFAVPDGALSTWFFTRTMRRRVMSAGLQDLARRYAVDLDWDRLRAAVAPSSPALFADRIRCPVLAVHGWHDVGMPGHDLLALFDRLTVPRRLYLGGGGHDGQDASEALALRRELVDGWLAHWLDGADDAPARGPRFWCARRPGWEHFGVERVHGELERTWFLRHGGALSADPPPGPTPNSNVQHRPLDPAYTLAVALDRDLAGTAEAWPREEAVFDGPALTEDLDLLGAPRFELHVLPDRPWMQVHTELWDVGPDGATLISHGHRGTHRADPGLHQRLDLRGRPVAYRVRAGHRLRVVVADQRPSHLVPEYRPWRARLYHEVGRASSVTLPVQPSSDGGP
jgi:predicted acyl esterase